MGEDLHGGQQSRMMFEFELRSCAERNVSAGGTGSTVKRDFAIGKSPAIKY